MCNYLFVLVISNYPTPPHYSVRGLVVPCIQCVEKLSILDIARELRCLREKAADGKLSQADLGLGGAKESKTTFSISNIGSLGGTYCSPIITPPQVCKRTKFCLIGLFLICPYRFMCWLIYIVVFFFFIH